MWDNSFKNQYKRPNKYFHFLKINFFHFDHSSLLKAYSLQSSIHETIMDNTPLDEVL